MSMRMYMYMYLYYAKSTQNQLVHLLIRSTEGAHPVVVASQNLGKYAHRRAHGNLYLHPCI